MSVTHAPVAVASAPSAASAVSAVSAKADWYPATAIPPAATVPPVTTRARRRVMLEFLWFPVMARNLGILSVRTLGGRCAQPEDAEKLKSPVHTAISGASLRHLRILSKLTTAPRPGLLPIWTWSAS